jgi:hypothetical protein
MSRLQRVLEAGVANNTGLHPAEASLEEVVLKLNVIAEDLDEQLKNLLTNATPKRLKIPNWKQVQCPAPTRVRLGLVAKSLEELLGRIHGIIDDVSEYEPQTPARRSVGPGVGQQD